MNATEKINHLNTLIASGKTIYIANHLHCYKIDRQVINRFRKAGVDILKAKGNSMYMASGNSFVCINYCNIRIA